MDQMPAVISQQLFDLYVLEKFPQYFNHVKNALNQTSSFYM